MATENSSGSHPKVPSTMTTNGEKKMYNEPQWYLSTISSGIERESMIKNQKQQLYLRIYSYFIALIYT